MNYEFIFLQRVKLFNAYSNDVMCKAGVSFLDIYPMSASYPYGTKDGIHYDSKVFYPVEDLLVNYFDREYRQGNVLSYDEMKTYEDDLR